EVSPGNFGGSGRQLIHGTHNLPGEDNGKYQSCDDQRTSYQQCREKPALRHSCSRLRFREHRFLIQMQEAITARPELMEHRFKLGEIGIASRLGEHLCSAIRRSTHWPWC